MGHFDLAHQLAHGPAIGPAARRFVLFGAQDHSHGGGRQHLGPGAEQPGHVGDGTGKVSRGLGQGNEHKVAERVPVQVASPEAVVEGPAHACSSGPGPARASRHRRTSPGAGPVQDARSRPLDPPSSAPETTAVTCRAYLETADKVMARPCPPPRATTDGRARPAAAPPCPFSCPSPRPPPWRGGPFNVLRPLNVLRPGGWRSG